MEQRDIVQGLITAGCAYEIAAIATKKMPTISTLCRQYRWAEVLLLGWLLYHLHRKREDLWIEEFYARKAKT